MKVLFIGGQKSGKSLLSEKKTLELSTHTPTYVATYDDSYHDSQMKKRIEVHQARREGRFESISEPLDLEKVLKAGECYLIDCLSMWIFNLLEAKIDPLPKLEKLLAIDATMVFVLNDVQKGIIPDNALSREYVDMSGIVGQIVAGACDEVYEVIVGLPKRLK